jgi:hypothetical protein
VTIFARLLSALGAARVGARYLILAVGLAASLSSALWLTTASANALVMHIGPVPVGLAPRIGSEYGLAGFPNGVPGKYLNSEGNPVLHASNTWAIYWDPTDHYHGDWQQLIDSYFHNAAAASGSLDSVFSVDSQYSDKSNKPAYYQQTFHGAYTDTHAYPTSGGCEDPDPFVEEDRIGPEVSGERTSVCLTSTQVANEVEAFVSAHGLPKGLGNVYYLLTPPGVTVCLDAGGPTGHCSDYEGLIGEESYENSFCSYHGAINPGNPPGGSANTILYAAIPWVAGGFADPHLRSLDRTGGYECQDGGYDPSSKPSEQHEKEKKLDKKEKEEFEAKNETEQAEALLAEKLEGPHEQEPNQETCPTEDGGCDYGLADLIINQISLEQQDIVTDPLLNAWQDPAHFENTDECRFVFAPILGGAVAANPETFAGSLFNQSLNGQSFYLNDAFNLAGLLLPFPGVGCLIGTSLEPKFTAPSPVNSEETVGFNGMESDISLNAGYTFPASGTPQPNFATYTWNFGDGSPLVSGYAPGAPACETPWLSPCAASLFHAYKYGGTYEVTLTVKDIGGNTASVTHEVTVIGPPPPGTPGGSGSGGGAGAGSAGQSSGAGASTTTGAGSAGSASAPIALATILSQSLRSALHRGLAVSYSVNEQVAGRFEVLLSRSVAHRLGISGSTPANMPAGSEPQLVIAKAVLVTTKGGHSAVHIQFSKHTAARLARLHKVSLMLRLTVRNGASSGSASATVSSSATLGH